MPAFRPCHVTQPFDGSIFALIGARSGVQIQLDGSHLANSSLDLWFAQIARGVKDIMVTEKVFPTTMGIRTKGCGRQTLEHSLSCNINGFYYD